LIVFLTFLLGFIIPVRSYGAESSRAKLILWDPGTENIIDYEKYGKFTGVKSEQYAYQILDAEGLKKASGEGVYPNESYLKDPAYKNFLSKYPGKISPWDFVDGPLPQDDFYAWCAGDAASNKNEGEKLFFRAEALRRAGVYYQALKAYYTIVIYFPRTVVWSADRSFYWYAAPEAISRIRKLCATYPELGVELKGALVDIDRSPEGKAELDHVRVNPGRMVPAVLKKTARADMKITARRCNGKVKLVKYNDKFWEMLVNDKPFFIKGLMYTCTTVGESAHALNLRPWMTLDDNHNGKNDGMFDSWVDRNRNNRQDPDEPVVGDAQLLKEMGANTIRMYHGVDSQGNYKASDYDKDLMRTLNRDYGIYFILGDFIGAYTVGSQADWKEGTDYTDPKQKERMKEVVRSMVLDHKDEPYTLCWLLGNENQNPGTHTNAKDRPEAYVSFLNEVAAMIHKIDPDHPVAVCNFNIANLKTLARLAPEIDIFGANIYAGAYSLGSVWQLTREIYDRPVLITEMGCPAYTYDKGLNEEGQADYLGSNWDDILLNAAANTGEGNAIGGIVFEWMDEWWKTSKGNSWGDPNKQNTDGDSMGPFPGGWMYEEWLGIVGQGDGYESHTIRQLRKAYETLKKKWMEPA
jgi:beta-glucuronidase